MYYNFINSVSASTSAVIKSLLISSIICLALTSLALAEGGSKQLLRMNFDDLLDLEVTSVSKKPQKVSESAAAIFVLTSEDIRRSGARSIADVLRLVPGLQVAQSNTHSYAISSRGLNDAFANKLLVLMDGRSVYTPLFAGVYWDAQDTLLEDIDRIEVIRGPGATLWGANAVNGIINIMTKSASDTNGTYISGGGGSEERAFSGVRQGGALSEDADYRLYAKHFQRDNSHSLAGGSADDGHDAYQAGFRTDWDSSENDSITFQGDIYAGDESQETTASTILPPFSEVLKDSTDYSGGNILARWSHKVSEKSDTSLQLYYDRTNRDDVVTSQSIDTYDVDFNHRIELSAWNELLWGLGYRYISDDVNGIGPAEPTPHLKRNYDLLSAFIQDEMDIIEDTLSFVIGTKLEENDFSGFEVQPSARLFYKVNEDHSFWGAFSHAVRTPSRAEEDIIANFGVLPGSPPSATSPGMPTTLFQLVGSQNQNAETVNAFELGYRGSLSNDLNVDLAAFFNSYDKLSSAVLGEPGFSTSPIPHAIQPLVLMNSDKTDSYGVEVVVDYSVLDWWRMQGSYWFINIDETQGPGTLSLPGSATTEGSNPHNSAVLRSLMDLPRDFELDTILRYVDNLPTRNVNSYIELDARLGLNINENFSISLVGRNLLNDEHQEFQSQALSTNSTEIERSFFIQAEYRN